MIHWVGDHCNYLPGRRAQTNYRCHRLVPCHYFLGVASEGIFFLLPPGFEPWLVSPSTEELTTTIQECWHLWGLDCESILGFQDLVPPTFNRSTFWLLHLPDFFYTFTRSCDIHHCQELKHILEWFLMEKWTKQVLNLEDLSVLA
jgi:hypothetical protein